MSVGTLVTLGLAAGDTLTVVTLGFTIGPPSAAGRIIKLGFGVGDTLTVVTLGFGETTNYGFMSGTATLSFGGQGYLINLPIPGRFKHSPAHIVQRLLICLGFGTNPDLSFSRTPGDMAVKCYGRNNPSNPQATPPPSWPIYVSHELTSPDNCITIYDREGTPDGRIMLTGQHQRQYGLSFRIRSTTHNLGYAKAHQLAIGVKDAHRLNVTLDDSNYDVHWIHRISNVVARGTDSPSSQRRVFSFEATVALKNYGENG